jgi:site-specific recombinase XerD
MDSKAAAQAWLKKQRDAVTEGVWEPPAMVVEVPAESFAPLFRAYATSWLAERGLKPRTVEGYQRMLDRHLLPKFGKQTWDSITVAQVKAWHKSLLVDNPTMRTHVYGLLRTILNTAFQDDLIPANPYRIPGSRNGEHMAPASLYKPWYRARENVGLPDLRWHDLRHFAGTTAAQTGATLAEVQGRLGHRTVQAVMRYQHAASGRDAEIADAMSKVVLKGKPA